MAENNRALSANISKASGAMIPSSFSHEVGAWYKNNASRIDGLAGGKSRVSLFVTAAFAQINKVPELLNCKLETFYSCLIHAMGCNLLPGPMGECYFIPFGNEAVFIPSYQGLVKLAYNSGFVTRITGHVVWSADEFDYNPATEEIFHRPFRGPEKDRGERIAAYIIIKNRFGEVQPMVKYAEFINSIKARSKGAKSKYSPWNSEYSSDVDAMWLKTVFKQAAKWIPKSTTPVGLQMAKAIEQDNQADSENVISANILSEELEHVQREVLEMKPEQEIVRQPGAKVGTYVDTPIKYGDDEK